MSDFIGQAEIKIHRVYLRDASFESNGPVPTSGWKPHLDVEMNTKSKKIDKQDDTYEVTLRVTITAKHEKKQAFLVEIQQSGVFSVLGADANQTKSILYTHCPNILFPFVRESIASLVAKGGFPQLLLGPMNFESIYRQKNEALKEQENITVTH